jgi:arylformamidase
MIIHDISMDIEPGMLYWRDGKPPEHISVERMDDGAPSEVTRWLMGSHTGTHIDAPSHFVKGAQNVEELSLDIFVGNTRVVDLTEIGDRSIIAEDIENANLNGVTRVLFRTTNSDTRMDKKEYDNNWVGIAPCAAQFLVDAGVVIAGLDYVTIEAKEHTDDWPSHHILCGNNVVILEGARLKNIKDGEYFMCCLPLRLKGSEAAATRTILIEGLTEF